MVVRREETMANEKETGILLVPWDIDSTEHVERMRDQGRGCGWGVAEVDRYREIQRKGEGGFFWLVSIPL